MAIPGLLVLLLEIKLFLPKLCLIKNIQLNVISYFYKYRKQNDAIRHNSLI